MLSSRRAMTLSLLFVATSAVAGASCKKKATPGALDGAANASDASAGASLEGGPASASSDTEAREPTVPSPVAAPAIPVAPREPLPTPFAGSYRCFKGMHLDQAGDLVTSTMHANGTTDTVVVCRVAGDECTGTVREIQTTRGKAPKVMHVKPVTLRRDANGDITYDVGAGEAKHGAGARDHTICLKR